jgi:hypothetical protein
MLLGCDGFGKSQIDCHRLAQWKLVALAMMFYTPDISH